MTEIYFSTASDAGSRSQNQDICKVFSPLEGHHVCLLADGLGGHDGGRVAAEIAVQVLHDRICTSGIELGSILGFVGEANAAICNAQRQAAHLRAMRTTLVLLNIDNHSAYWAHCGDSRLYHIRNDKILSVTRDHSVSQMLVSDGELNRDDIRSHPDRHKLFRSLGGEEAEARARVVREPSALMAGDSFLLCTDGWWESVSDEQILESIAPDPQIWLDNMQHLIVSDRARETDNFTAIAVKVNQI